MKIISTYPQSRYIGPVHSAKRFTFKDKTFVAEASDFIKIYGQLYDDAADQGFLIVNNETGMAVPFVYDRAEKQDGELVAEHFKVDPTAVRKDYRLAGLKVVIFND